MLPLLQAASPAGPGSRLSLPDLQVPSAELPRTEAQAEHAPARLHLASHSEPVKSSKIRNRTANQPNLPNLAEMEIFICLAVT